MFSGKGGKNRRRGKNENEAEKRELEFKDEGQEYAQVSDFFHITMKWMHIEQMWKCPQRLLVKH